MCYFPCAVKPKPSLSALAVLLLLAAHAAQAAEKYPAWSYKGFGSFSGSGTDTHLLGFQRDTTQGNGVTRSWGIGFRLKTRMRISFA